MKIFFSSFLILFTIFLTACQPPEPFCPEGSLTYLNAEMPIPTTEEQPASLPKSDSITIDLEGKMVQFDQVIHGPVCNNHLNGKVYIACDIQIPQWQDKPNFLDGCDFDVSPDAVVYVAAHNNAIYYQGCDFCHKSHSEATP